MIFEHIYFLTYIWYYLDMAKTETVRQFAKGDMVVYPIQGVGRIDEIEERTFKGKPLEYYVISLEAADMVLRVPVKRSEDLGIRSIVSRDLAEKALKSISKEPLQKWFASFIIAARLKSFLFRNANFMMTHLSF